MCRCVFVMIKLISKLICNNIRGGGKKNKLSIDVGEGIAQHRILVNFG